jgi:hypothetical protein
MHVDYVEILLFKIHLIKSECISKLLVSYIVKRTCWRFKELSNLWLFSIQILHIRINIFFSFYLFFKTHLKYIKIIQSQTFFSLFLSWRKLSFSRNLFRLLYIKTSLLLSDHWSCELCLISFLKTCRLSSTYVLIYSWLKYRILDNTGLKYRLFWIDFPLIF